MGIDKTRAFKALAKLEIDQEQRDRYAEMIERGESYEDLIFDELGDELGERYLTEEVAQHSVIYGAAFEPENISVAEFLLMEESAEEEPWHQKAGGYAQASGAEKFSQEAGEPWHRATLVEAGYDPDVRVASWFEDHPEYRETTKRIHQLVESAMEDSDDDFEDEEEEEEIEEDEVDLL